MAINSDNDPEVLRETFLAPLFAVEKGTVYELKKRK